MNKQQIETSLSRMWCSWLEAEYNRGRLKCVGILDFDKWFKWRTRLDADHNPEMFLLEYEEHLNQAQIEFINHFIQVMVEFDNHDYL